MRVANMTCDPNENHLMKAFAGEEAYALKGGEGRNVWEIKEEGLTGPRGELSRLLTQGNKETVVHGLGSLSWLLVWLFKF